MAEPRPGRTKPDPRVNPWRDDLAAEHLRGEVAAPRYVKGETFSIVAPVTALRRAAAHGAAMDTQLLFGENFRVYDRRGIWAWGQSGYDDYVGYVLAEDLGPVQKPSHVLAVPRSFVLTDADIKSRPLMSVSMGARLAVKNSDAQFSELQNGAFIPTRHLAPHDRFEDDPISVARRFIGAPYLWGGRESLGLDCSALVQLALMRCGRACPRDSDMQLAVLGRPVDTARKGDLVFWKGHVGLLSDDTTLLHANAHHMQVVEEDFATACDRIAASDGPVTGVRRLD